MIRILTAYADLMNQYGEYAALRVLRARLEAAGEQVEIDGFSLGDTPSLENCDLLYCPAGTELSMLAARADARRLEDKLTDYFERGGLALCTGNAMGLFAKTVRRTDGEKCEGIGWLDCELRLLPGRRYTELLAQSGVFSGELVGSINSSMQVESREEPLFEVLFDASGALGAPFEGMKRQNLLATQMTGPLLVRNPFALDDLCERLCGHALPECTESWYAYAVAGWKNAVDTLKKESGKQG